MRKMFGQNNLNFSLLIATLFEWKLCSNYVLTEDPTFTLTAWLEWIALIGTLIINGSVFLKYLSAY